MCITETRARQRHARATKVFCRDRLRAVVKENIKKNPLGRHKYISMHKGYYCLDTQSNRVYISRYVVFDESQFPFDKNTKEVTTASPKLVSSTYKETWIQKGNHQLASSKEPIEQCVRFYKILKWCKPYEKFQLLKL